MRQFSKAGRRRATLTTLAFGLCMAVLFSGGRAVERVAAVPQETYDELETFTNILSIVQKNYVDEVDTKQLIEGAVNGMLTSLDPHSAYLTPELYKELQVDTKGSFGGLGIEITNRGGVLTVVSPIEDTPAARAGIQPGDQIIKIDGQFTKDLSLAEAVKKMRGPRGSKVVISVKREGVSQLLDFTLTRENIQIQSVKYKDLGDGYGYIRLTQFQERTATALEEALRALNGGSEDKLRGLILDLRNDPGGLLSQAVKVADTFLDSGLIVYTDGRLDSQKQKYFAHKPGSHTEFPMVVLVNGGTASAAEIVAGALQDHKRALVLGTQTFGKGSVQTILPLDDQSALRLTTALYYTPSGRSIQATGIVPDIAMENNVQLARTDARKSPATQFLREENLPKHLENGNSRDPDADPSLKPESKPIKDGSEEPTDEEEPPAEDPAVQGTMGELGKDPQLDRALELLKSWQVFKTLVAKND
jgi:carboxyl-terminal processing protease